VRGLSWDAFTELVAPFLLRLDGTVDRDTNLEEAGLESLSLVELIAEIETIYEIEFPIEMLNWDTFVTAGTLYETTAALLGNDR
jgi:acyl carrier protein